MGHAREALAPLGLSFPTRNGTRLAEPREACGGAALAGWGAEGRPVAERGGRPVGGAVLAPAASREPGLAAPPVAGCPALTLGRLAFGPLSATCNLFNQGFSAAL